MSDVGSSEQGKKCLIVARNSTDIRPVLLHALEAMGWDIAIFSDRDEASKSPEDDLMEYLEAHALGHLVVVGGDGTLRLVTHALQTLKRSIPILLVPSGTANDFARTLTDMIGTTHQVIEAALDEHICCDVSRVQTEGDQDTPSGSRVAHFINMMVIGGGAENSMTISSNLKQIVGSAAYLKQLYHSLTVAGGFSVDVSSSKIANGSSDVPEDRYHCSAIFVANGRTCGGGYSIVPNADPADGVLDVVVVKDISMWEKLKLAASFMSDQHLASESTEYFRVKEVELTFDTPQAVTLDGECITTKRVKISAGQQCQSISVFYIDQRMQRALNETRPMRTVALAVIRNAI